MIRYLGIFCIGCAVALQMSKKKSDKGEETWESKHNITYLVIFLKTII